jgi:hypothetical protein
MASAHFPDDLTKKEKITFAELFLREYLKGGLCSMSKRETELLVFHALCDTGAFRKISIYDRANALRITEGKVKSLRLDAAQRYAPLDHKTAIRDLLVAVVRDKTITPEYIGDRIRLPVEDPCLRRELEYALKQTGAHADYTFNRDILVVPLAPFLDLLRRTLALGDEELAAMIAAADGETKEAQALMASQLPFMERVKTFFEQKKAAVGVAAASAKILPLVIKVIAAATAT